MGFTMFYRLGCSEEWRDCTNYKGDMIRIWSTRGVEIWRAKSICGCADFHAWRLPKNVPFIVEIHTHTKWMYGTPIYLPGFKHGNDKWTIYRGFPFKTYMYRWFFHCHVWWHQRVNSECGYQPTAMGIIRGELLPANTSQPVEQVVGRMGVYDFAIWE